MWGERQDLQTVTFRDGRSGVGWIAFLLLLIAIGGYMLYMCVSTSMFGGALGLLAVSAIGWDKLLPRVTVAVAPDGVTVWEIWPWRERESRYPAAELSVPHIVEVDCEDSLRYDCHLRLPSGRMVTVFRADSRERATEVHSRLQAALAAAARRPAS